MKTGKCNTEYAAYYLDQYWKQNPGATVRNHHTLSNHDFSLASELSFSIYHRGETNRQQTNRLKR